MKINLQEEITNLDKNRLHQKTKLYRKIEVIYDPLLSFDNHLNKRKTQ